MINKQIYEIFSKQQTREKQTIEKEIKKDKIIIDYRERNSLVPAQLNKLGYEIEFRELKVGDYIVKDIAIERKTVSDFISSMINRRLIRQLEELQQYPLKLLIIEGIEEQELYNEKEINGVHPNSIRGFILTILLKWKVPIILSQNPQDTASYIDVIAKKKEIESSIRANKKSLSIKEQSQYILEGFPGIGPKSAKKLLEEFKSLKNIFNASEEELTKTIGKKSNVFKRILEHGSRI
jgi:ERCC4-type nuclease